MTPWAKNGSLCCANDWKQFHERISMKNNQLLSWDFGASGKDLGYKKGKP